jgi:hypothetical protein
MAAGLPALVQREREVRLAAAQAQVAYDAEVAALKLGKLHAYFESRLVEHVVAVHPLGTVPAGSGRSNHVTTFRPPELPQEVLVSWLRSLCTKQHPLRFPAMRMRPFNASTATLWHGLWTRLQGQGLSARIASMHSAPATYRMV